MTTPLTKTPLDLTAPGLMQDRKYGPLDSFLKLHTPIVTGDANGNGDDVFKASNIEAVDRTYGRHGYEDGDDNAIYANHNEDILDALRKTHEAVRGMMHQAWNVHHSDPSGADPSDPGV